MGVLASGGNIHYVVAADAECRNLDLTYKAAADLTEYYRPLAVDTYGRENIVALSTKYWLKRLGHRVPDKYTDERQSDFNTLLIYFCHNPRQLEQRLVDLVIDNWSTIPLEFTLRWIYGNRSVLLVTDEEVTYLTVQSSFDKEHGTERHLVAVEDVSAFIDREVRPRFSKSLARNFFT